jgi:hypothetical protein
MRLRQQPTRARVPLQEQRDNNNEDNDNHDDHDDQDDHGDHVATMPMSEINTHSRPLIEWIVDSVCIYKYKYIYIYM